MEFALEVVTTVLEYFGWDRHEIEVSFFYELLFRMRDHFDVVR